MAERLVILDVLVRHFKVNESAYKRTRPRADVPIDGRRIGERTRLAGPEVFEVGVHASNWKQ